MCSPMSLLCPLFSIFFLLSEPKFYHVVKPSPLNSSFAPPFFFVRFPCTFYHRSRQVSKAEANENLMLNDMKGIQDAGRLIERARDEESPEGNPLIAARCYIDAMEIVISTAARYAAAMDDLASRRAFLSQMRSRVELYYERADLLLQVAAEMGLPDAPDFGDELPVLPPPVYGGIDKPISAEDSSKRE